MSNGIIKTLVGAGILLAHIILSTADVHAKKPRPPIFPPIDPSRVDCTAFRAGNEEQCYSTANEVFQLASLILSQFAANDWAAAEQDTLPTTPQLFPDGTVIRGIDPDVLPTIAAWIGSNNFAFVSIADTFMYRPLDQDFVILFGGLNFTLVDYEHGGMVRTIHDAQTEMFRRNPQMPRGWELVYEQIGYITPLLGD
jgi:hypothetical protein